MRETPRVLIIQALMKPYRVPFFTRLGETLAGHGVGLRVAYGQPGPREARKGDAAELPAPWGLPVRNRWLAGERVLWQPVWRAAVAADLVVVEQANKHLINPLLLARARLGGPRVAFWGHGRNRAAPAGTLAERAKRALVRAPHWWFAYTEGVAGELAAHGVAPARITAVNNAADTAAFAAQLAAVDEAQLALLRDRLGISAGAPVGLYCGALYPAKRPDLLVEAALQVRAARPDFHLLVLGAGPEQAQVQAAARAHAWIHAPGAVFGAARAPYFRLADFFVHPGVVGLAVLDAFVAGLPTITCQVPGHGPEVDYLRDGENALVVAPDAGMLARAVLELAADPARRAALATQARADAGHYSLDGMVARFAQGALAALAAPPAWRERAVPAGGRAQA